MIESCFNKPWDVQIHRLHNQGRTNLEQLADLQHLREPQLIPLQSELVSYFM